MDGTEYIPPILDKLLAKDVRRLTDMRDSLIETNHKLGNPRQGFLFGGTFHTGLQPREAAAAEKRLLHPELHEEGRRLMQEVKLVKQESQRLSSGLTMLLRGCHSLQDVRDALPDLVVSLFSELSALPRTRDEGYTLAANPLHFHDYQQTAELLSFYTANRMLY